MKLYQISSLLFLSLISILGLILSPLSLTLKIFLTVCAICNANFFEYGIHRWFLHQKPTWAPNAYRYHAGFHHSRYRSHSMVGLDEKKNNIFSSILGQISILITGLAASIIIGILFGFLIGFYWYMIMILYYVIYEIAHYSTHLPEKNVVRKIFPNYIFRHHQKHHDTRKMRKGNFNVLFPLFDWLFKTILPPN